MRAHAYRCTCGGLATRIVGLKPKGTTGIPPRLVAMCDGCALIALKIADKHGIPLEAAPLPPAELLQ